jgi:hypothetical protein
MPKSTKTFRELLAQYKVTANYSIDSSLVYPMDVGSKFEFHGYIPEEDVKIFVNKISYLLDENLEMRVSSACIANKYAIPFMQVGHMRTIETFFYYQHDGKTWLISFKEETTDYLG